MRSIISALVVASMSISALAAPGKVHKIDPTKASKIALAKYHGKLFKSPHLEHEDGQWQYEVLVKSKGQLFEVNVNADSGKISSVEKTSMAEEAREARSEKKGD